MTNEEKFNLITRNLEEVLTEEELRALIDSGKPLRHYIGFEISGKVHLGQGLAVMQKVKEIHEAGVETIIFLADWHSWINNKLDGTLQTAKRLAREYFEEALKAAYLCVGGNPDDLKFILGSELYDKTYWPKVIGVAKATTISRMIRSTDIMGRMAGDSSDTATLFYPAMQAADIFQLGVNIAHAGTDQRNVHIVARDAAKHLGEKKPVAIHHHLIAGLIKPAVWPLPKENRNEAVTAMKMSKSKPDSAVFIHDSPEEIRRKVGNAFCPEGEEGEGVFNPILDWVKHLIFYYSRSGIGIGLRSGKTPSKTVPGFTVKRDPKWGGDLIYKSYEDLEKDYSEKKLHPQDLKNAVAQWLVDKLSPARKYFEDPKRKKALKEITILT